MISALEEAKDDGVPNWKRLPSGEWQKVGAEKVKLKQGLQTDFLEDGLWKRIKAIPTKIKEFFNGLAETFKRMYRKYTDPFRKVNLETEIAKKVYGEDLFNRPGRNIRNWNDITDEDLDWWEKVFQLYYSISSNNSYVRNNRFHKLC